MWISCSKLVRSLFFLMGCFSFAIGNSDESSSTLDKKAEMLIRRVDESLSKAHKNQSKLSKEVLKLKGMSGQEIRHFLNNVCAYPNTYYMEIGCWQGSTFISALFGNQSSISDAVAIDNWTEFGGPRQEFISNTEHLISDVPFRFFEQDCFSIDKKKSFKKPVNVYFYDGHHSEQAQELAFTYFDEILDDVFIALVDDWNWDQVRRGTFTAFQKLGYKVLYQKEFFIKERGEETWWNGFYIGVIQKTSQSM